MSLRINQKLSDLLTGVAFLNDTTKQDIIKRCFRWYKRNKLNSVVELKENDFTTTGNVIIKLNCDPELIPENPRAVLYTRLSQVKFEKPVPLKIENIYYIQE